MARRWLPRTLLLAFAWAAACAPVAASAQAAVAAAPVPAGVTAGFGGARWSRVEGGQGVPINVVEKGDASLPSIVFIHGYRQTHLSWFAQFGSDLSERCHLVAYDLRGHGDSGAPWQADGYDGSRPWADDLARVIRATGARQPLLVGWSFGGNVAMDFVREHAEAELAGLVLVGSAAELLPRAAPAPRAVPQAELATRVAAAARSAELLYGAGVEPSLKALFASASLRTSPFVDAPTAARLLGPGNADLVPRLHWPITLVNGARDPIVPRETVERLQALLPAARGVAFPTSGHAPFVDDAERFNAMLDAMQCRAASAPPRTGAVHG